MNNEIGRVVLGGIVGTILLTLVAIFIAPMMGLEMSPPKMVAGMLGMPIAIGWIIHFMMGIVFAFVYFYIFRKLLGGIHNVYLKGIIFGLSIFILAILGMTAMGQTGRFDGMMLQFVMGLAIAHMLYGIGVTKTIEG